MIPGGPAAAFLAELERRLCIRSGLRRRILDEALDHLEDSPAFFSAVKSSLPPRSQQSELRQGQDSIGFIRRRLPHMSRGDEFRRISGGRSL